MKKFDLDLKKNKEESKKDDNNDEDILTELAKKFVFGENLEILPPRQNYDTEKLQSD